MSSARSNINLLEELTLGNFKCFSATQKLPLRPITLLYGPNGAGKSSVIQALSWLPELSSGTWHQKFERFVRNRDPQSDITFGVKISLAAETFTSNSSDSFFSKMRHQIASNVATFAFEAQLTGKSPLPEFQNLGKVPCVSWSGLSINDVRFIELRYWLAEAGLTTYVIEHGSRLQVAEFNSRHPILPLLLNLSKELALHRIRSRKSLPTFDPVMQQWEAAIENFDLSTITASDLPEADDIELKIDAHRLPIRVELDERDRDFSYVSYVSSDESESIWLRVPALEMFRKPNWNDKSEVKERILDHFRLSLGLLLNFLSDLDELTAGFSSPFWQIVHLGALRSVPVGEFLLTDPDKQRRRAPDWRLSTTLDGIQRQIDSVNGWLASLGRRDTAYKFLTAQLDAAEVMEGVEPNKEQHLRFKGIRDLQRNIIVPLSETGTGFSQLLPIVLAAFSRNGELVTIQQPELRLHPALQSELGDLFITSALGGAV